MITETLIVVAIVLVVLQYLTNKRPKNFPPGPTGIPVVGYSTFLRHPIQKGFQDVSKKYGDIFGVMLASFPVVVLSDLKLAREAFEDDRLSGRPELDIFKQRSFGKQRGIVLGTGKDWVEQRRFTVKHLRNLGFGKSSMEELIKDEVVDVIANLKKEVNRPINLQSRFTTALLNALWHIVSGERFPHDDPKLKKIISTLVEVAERPRVQGAIFFMPWLTKVFPKLSGFELFLDAMKETYDFMGQTVNAHKKTIDVDNPRDFIDEYLKEIEKTKDPNSSFYKDEGEIQLLTVLQDIFFAGVETTSNVLSWILLYMIMFPEVQEKVYKEIESAVGTSRLPSITDKPNLPYTEAVIAEVERMTTLTPLGAPHCATEDVEFHGYTIPKGAIVIANLWQMHNDEKYWGDPQNFRPERFLNKEGEYKKDNQLNIFAVGKRQCPGELLANDEIFLFASALLQNFRFETDKNSAPPTLVAKNALLTHVQPYRVIIRDRTALNSQSE